MDWRVVIVSVLFGAYLGVLAGTRREADRRDAMIALGIAFVAGIGTALFGTGSEAADLAATSLSIGPPVAILTTWAIVRIRT